VRENKCKARYFAAQDNAAAGFGTDMMESAEDGEALNALARKYLNLWLEHWASCLAAPEAAAAMARIFAPAHGTNLGTGLAGFDGMPGWPGAWNEPSAFRTAPNAGDGGADELEKRVAELERRLAALESGHPTVAPAPPTTMAGSAGKPRRRTRKV
jgi:hypothetical protein